MRTAAKILAILGAVASLGVVILFTANQAAPPNTRLADIFPFPLLYFLEIAVISLTVTALVLIESQRQVGWQALGPWLCAGVLLAFVVLGSWTIGFYLIPAFVAYLAAGIVIDFHRKSTTASHFAIFIMAALIQAGLMLFFVYLS